MTDIAKCAGLQVNGEPCPQRESCWRWVAPVDKRWQSWSGFSFDGEKGGCSAFWWTPARREASARA